MAMYVSVFMLALFVVLVRCEEIRECTSQITRSGRCVLLENCPEIHKLTLNKPIYPSDMEKIIALAGACGSSLRSANFSVCCENSNNGKERVSMEVMPSSTTSRPTRPKLSTSSSRTISVLNPVMYSDITTTTRTTFRPPKRRPSPPERTTARSTSGSTRFPSIASSLPAQCGQQPPSHHIWSDVEDSDHVHVWAVLLEISKSKNITGRCVGTMITESYVLTAAHCLYHVKLDDVALYYGLIARSELASCLNDESCQERKAAEFIIHEGYHVHQKLNDIALIRVEDPVNTSDYIAPICLPLNHTFDEAYSSGGTRYSTVIAVGWGRTFGEKLSDKKRLAFLRVIPQDECAKSLRFNTTVLSSMMCTLGNQPGQDVCQGDSGAPLVQNYQRLMYVVGVVSYGPRCGMSTDVPGKAMRVSHYLNWILTTIRRYA
uniref:CLIP domain-containing serine protease n=1 Tax=Anopheles atroparvus TaxID=41427 RepID=A0A182JN06_ANOAO